MVDFYAVLQVARDADQATITAAYQRLRQAYNPDALQGVSEELRALASERALALDQAYAILSDATMRAAYDAGVTSVVERAIPVTEPTYDYRPLPAAQQHERAPEFDVKPVRSGRSVAGDRQTALWLTIVIPLVIVFVTYIITDGGRRTAPRNDAPPVAVATAVSDQFEESILAARRATEENPTSISAWVDYANLLYNSVQIVREQQPGSTLYLNRLARWQMAADAYAKALSFDPSNVVVQADMGASRCFYGNGIGSSPDSAAGLAQLREALPALPDSEKPRALLNLGYCLAEITPQQIDAAIEAWQQIVDIEPSDSPFAIQATKLIAQLNNR